MIAQRLARRMVSLALAGLLFANPVAAATEQPINVLLITVDTLRADHLGAFGYRRKTSPAVDALAARSIVFEKTFTQGGWTKPAMASLMLSLYPHNHNNTSEDSALPSNMPTLAEVLKENGYSTFGIQTNPFLKKQQRFGQGFDSYDFQADATAKWVVDEFIAKMPADTAAPWFMYLHFMDPHLPYKAPAGAFSDPGYQGPLAKSDKLNPRKIRRMIPTLTPDDRNFLVDRYDEEILYFDGQFERVIKHLDGRGLLERTIIIIHADHGEEFFEHGGFEHGHSLFNEILHVPLIIYEPRLNAKRVPQLSRLIDVYPTLLSLLGIDIPRHVMGADLKPLMTGASENSELKSYSESLRIGPQREALQDLSHKIIHTEGAGSRLYDLASDPGERNDRSAASDDAILEKYSRELRTFRESGPNLKAAEPEFDPDREETVKALKSLGYLK